MEDLRLRFKLRSKNPPLPSVETPLLLSKIGSHGKWGPSRFAGAIFFGVNSAIGYMLMLVVMSFNAGVFVALVVGLGISYLIFSGGDEDVVVVDNPCVCA